MSHQSLISILLTLMILSSCALFDNSYDRTLNSEVLHNNLLCAADQKKPALEWLDDNSQLVRYLDGFSDEDKAAVAAVDFNSNGVIAITMGPQPSTGYRLNLIAQKGVQFNGRVIRVNIAWEEPDPDTAEAQVATNPCLLLSAERVNFQRLELVDQNDYIRLETRP